MYSFNQITMEKITKTKLYNTKKSSRRKKTHNYRSKGVFKVQKYFFALVFLFIYNTFQAQVKPGLTSREKQIISNACLNMDAYVKNKNTATGLTIGGFVLTGGGILLINTDAAASYGLLGIGGSLFLISYIVDRSASKHIGKASNNLRRLTDFEDLELPEIQ